MARTYTIAYLDARGHLRLQTKQEDRVVKDKDLGPVKVAPALQDVQRRRAGRSGCCGS